MQPAPIVSPNARIRHPDIFVIGRGSILDDFCYVSTQLQMGEFVHVASGCSIAGGKDHRCVIGDCSSLSSGVKVWCASDDFVRDVVTVIPSGYPPIKEHLIEGDVTFGAMTAVGANTVIMPNNTIPEGTVIGALSFVPPNFAFKPWMVYAGIPVKPLQPRDRESVLRQAAKLREYADRQQS